MEMGTVDVVFVTLSNNITFLGKTWWILMVLLRLLVLLLSGFTLFRGDEEGFVCNTIQPGCVSVCFDAFAPLSLLPFLWFQLLVLSLPHVAFLTYVGHRALSFHGAEPYSRLSDGRRAWSSSTLRRHSQREPSPTKPPPPLGRPAPDFRCAYFLDLILRMLLEAAFMAGQFYLYGFSVPRSFLCHEAPCFSGVACYVSRPTEKTLLLNLMLGVASLSLLLCLVDFASSLRRTGRRRRTREMLDEELSRGEQSSVFMGNGVLEDTEVLLTKTAPGGGYNRGVNAGAAPSNGVPNGVPVLPHHKPESLAVGVSTQGEGREHGDDKMAAAPCLPVLAGTLGHGRYVRHDQLKPPPSPRSGRGAAPRPGVFAASAGARRAGRYSPVTGSDPQSDSSEVQDRGAYV